MSKSLGNSMTIKQALEKYDKEVLRYAMLSKHYSSDLDLNEHEFALAEKHMYYFYNSLNSIQETDDDYSIKESFVEAMDDDFNSALAIANLFDIFKYTNSNKQVGKVKTEIKELYKILGLFQQEPQKFLDKLKNKHLDKLGLSKEYIELQINSRTLAKQNKDYKTADEIRNKLLEQGIIINDSKNGTTWDIKELYS